MKTNRISLGRGGERLIPAIQLGAPEPRRGVVENATPLGLAPRREASPLSLGQQAAEQRLGEVRVELASRSSSGRPTRNKKSTPVAEEWNPGSKRDREILEARFQRKQRGEKNGVGRLVASTIATVIESIPGGVGPWGIGDAVTFLEGLFGITADFTRLTSRERVICFLAAIIPVIPARPFVAARRKQEEAQYERWRATHQV